jgi:hypothetical protein
MWVLTGRPSVRCGFNLEFVEVGQIGPEVQISVVAPWTIESRCKSNFGSVSGAGNMIVYIGPPIIILWQYIYLAWTPDNHIAGADHWHGFGRSSATTCRSGGSHPPNWILPIVDRGGLRISTAIAHYSGNSFPWCELAARATKESKSCTLICCMPGQTANTILVATGNPLCGLLATG